MKMPVKELVLENLRVIIHGVANVGNFMWVSSEHFERM
jgi:hypothetical protein